MDKAGKYTRKFGKLTKAVSVPVDEAMRELIDVAKAKGFEFNKFVRDLLEANRGVLETVAQAEERTA